MSYKIKGNNITFDDKKITAKDLFNQYYKRNNRDLIAYIESKNIFIHKYPQELLFILDINSEGKIFFDIFLKDFKKKINFNFNYDDSVILENIWYPIDEDNLYESNKILKKLNITSKNINLFQYLSLNIESSIMVENRAAEKLEKLKFIKKFDTKNIPNFMGKLGKYQEIGVQWMYSMYEENVGVILADEMGLGKTIQYIALFCKINNGSKKLSLVLTNSSNLENVKREFDKFTKDLNYIIYSGSDRNPLPKMFLNQNVVITSYDILINDIVFLEQFQWELIVSDEAQYIKNPEAKRAKSIKKLNSKFNLAISGTPYENNLNDLWSIFQFIMPVWLGDFNKFKQSFENNEISAEKLNPIIKPLILQRKINEVEKELPEKIFIDQIIELDDDLKERYEKIRSSSNNENNLMNLKIFCNYPNMLPDHEDYNFSEFPKIKFLFEKLIELKKNNKKSLIFIKFKKLIYFMEEKIKKELGIYCNKIYGGTEIPKRQGIIDEFSSVDGSAVLLLNPEAASVGLNITSANYVFLYSPEWKPSIEKQAIARAYRKGQKQTVFAYRLSYKKTIEEYIIRTSKFKESINDIVLPGHIDELSDINVNEALSETPV